MHEQLIDSLKNDGGGIIGIIENPVVLHRFMTAGPELICIVDEIEQSINCTTDLKTSCILNFNPNSKKSLNHWSMPSLI